MLKYCYKCRVPMEYGHITSAYEKAGHIIFLRGVPSLVCPVCGTDYVLNDITPITDKIEALLEQRSEEITVAEYKDMLKEVLV